MSTIITNNGFSLNVVASDDSYDPQDYINELEQNYFDLINDCSFYKHLLTLLNFSKVIDKSFKDVIDILKHQTRNNNLNIAGWDFLFSFVEYVVCMSKRTTNVSGLEHMRSKVIGCYSFKDYKNMTIVEEQSTSIKDINSREKELSRLISDYDLDGKQVSITGTLSPILYDDTELLKVVVGLLFIGKY